MSVLTTEGEGRGNLPHGGARKGVNLREGEDWEGAGERGTVVRREVADRNALDRCLDVDLSPLVDSMFTTHVIAQDENEHAVGGARGRGGGRGRGRGREGREGAEPRGGARPLTVYSCDTCEKVGGRSVYLDETD